MFCLLNFRKLHKFLINSLSEERLTRKKCHFGFPILSIKKLLEIGKINGEDISIVTIASKELDVSNKKIHSEIFKYALGKEYEKIASKTKYNISETIKLISFRICSADFFSLSNFFNKSFFL